MIIKEEETLKELNNQRIRRKKKRNLKVIIE